jgi:hypothetical protein
LAWSENLLDGLELFDRALDDREVAVYRRSWYFVMFFQEFAKLGRVTSDFREMLGLIVRIFGQGVAYGLSSCGHL